MPYIGTKTTTSISPERAAAIKSKLGKAIELLPGKTERWLMVELEENSKLYFAGDDSADSAFVNVSLLGAAGKAAYEKLTSEICVIIGDELNISPDRIYVKYEECEHWGWNGGNF